MNGFLEPLFQCEASDIVRLALLLLGGLASLATVTAALYRLYRWLRPRGPTRVEKRAVRAIRDIANELVASGQPGRAIRLYNATFITHPRSAETYFRRGVAHEADGKMEKA